jgi:hypothetical protein
MYLTALCLLAAATVNQAGGTAVPFEDRFGTLEHWDLLDMRGDSHIAVAQDHTVPTGFGPTVLAIKGYHVIGLAKGLRLDTGTILVLYRECDPRGMDADGLLVCHASYDDSVSEEHNTKQVRSHVWLEQDNDAGLQFRSYREDGVESLLAERPGYGLITEDWNETNWIWQKLRFEGRRLRGKFWPAHIPEPDGWAIDTECDGIVAGRVGFRLGSGLVHIAYFAAAADDFRVPPPDYWLFPKTEAFPDTSLPSFTLYTNGRARLLAARWTLSPGDMPVDAHPQGLEIAAGPHAIPVRPVLHNGEDNAVGLALSPGLLGSKTTFRLGDSTGTTLAETRVRRVDTQDLRRRIAALEHAASHATRSPATEAALALLARTRRLLFASDFVAAERSLAYAEEYQKAGSSAPAIAKGVAARPFAPPLAAASIKTRDGQILVNGEPFIIKGVNVHSLDPSSQERTRKMLQILKNRGFNMLRGDFPPRWQVDMAHEMGLAWSVLAPFSVCSTDEIFARQDGSPMTAARAITAAFIDDYVDSPGVLIWNSCNEIGNDTADFLTAMYPVYRHRDPYRRPVHYANLFGQDRWEGQDIMGVNYYYGRGQTPEDRQPIILRSIRIAREHGLPIIFTEYNSYLGPIPETGVRAIYGMFQWGIENGMSGGFFYMKNDSKDHPGVFNNNLETHPEMDAAFIDVFADARLDGMPRHGGTLRLRLINKRPFTLRKVHLSGEVNGTPIADQPLAEFPPHSVRDVPVQLPEEIGPEIIFVGALDFVTHYSFPCHVPLHGAVPTIIESNE